MPVLPPICCWQGLGTDGARATASQAGEPCPACPGSCCFPWSLNPSGIICLLAESSVGCRGVPAQGSSQHSPVCSMQAASGSRLLHKAEMGSKAVCEARWRKTQQRLVHAAQMWKTILYPLEPLVLERVLQQRDELWQNPPSSLKLSPPLKIPPSLRGDQGTGWGRSAWGQGESSSLLSSAQCPVPAPVLGREVPWMQHCTPSVLS